MYPYDGISNSIPWSMSEVMYPIVHSLTVQLLAKELCHLDLLHAFFPATVLAGPQIGAFFVWPIVFWEKLVKLDLTII